MISSFLLTLVACIGRADRGEELNGWVQGVAGKVMHLHGLQLFVLQLHYTANHTEEQLCSCSIPAIYRATLTSTHTHSPAARQTMRYGQIKPMRRVWWVPQLGCCMDFPHGFLTCTVLGFIQMQWAVDYMIAGTSIETEAMFEVIA